MALVSCPQCDRRINSTSENCIHCGFVLEHTLGSAIPTNSGSLEERKVSYSEAKASLEDRVYKALLAAGRPPLVYRGGAITWKDPLTEQQFQAYALSFLGPEAGGIWKAAGMPDISTFIAGLEEQFGNLLHEPEVDNVRLIESDREFKAWSGKQAFKLWKKRGRPPVVIIGEQFAMYQVQWEFENFFGYTMDSNMLEAWYLAGSPDLRTWDVSETMEQYNELIMELYDAQNQVISNGIGGVFDALGDGFRQVAASLEQDQTAQSNSVDELKRAMEQVRSTPPSQGTRPKPQSKGQQEQAIEQSWGSGKSYYHACRACGSPNNVSDASGGWPRTHWWKCMTCGHKEEFVP